MAVCMGANPQGLEYGQHYRRAGNRPLDDGKYCLILQKQRPEHFAPAAAFFIPGYSRTGSAEIAEIS